jgi:cell division protein ZapA
MTTKQPIVSVTILGKEYKIACSENEQQGLISSATKLDQQMREIRDTGKVSGADRIAVLAALNLTHELSQIESQKHGLSKDFKQRLLQIQKKIESAINSTQ